VFIFLARHLGVIFIVASVSELSTQSLFIREVVSYGILPYTLARVYGAVLPWVELLVGCSLILGLFITFSLTLCLLMTLSFIIANTYALYQGIIDNCGCFGQLIPLEHTASLTIDILILIVTVVLLFYRKKATSISVGILVSKFNSITKREPRHLVQKMAQAIILLVVILATGLPLALVGTTSLVYSEIDSSLEQGKIVFTVLLFRGMW
jgi:uncharacterized membrane protein YphA (DoxX/SURF4 family)